MTNLLSDVRKILKIKASREVQKSTGNFVPTVKKNYGVSTSVLNDLANRFKNGGFELVEALWKSCIYEEQLLAAKILGKICKENPDRTINFIKNNINGITDWAVCDTLATQGIRKIAKEKQKELFELSRKCVLSKNFWHRRFGLVLLINFAKDKKTKKNIESILRKVENDKEPYVKKAVVWLKSKLEKIKSIN